MARASKPAAPASAVRLREAVSDTLRYLEEANRCIASLLSAVQGMKEPAPPVVKQAAAKEFLSVKEAAEFTGYTTSTLYRMIHDGQIPGHKPTRGHLVFRRTELAEFMSRGKKAASYELRENAAQILNGEAS